jgi:hypothetical protein
VFQANTKKQKYQRILERKQQTFPEQLCRGYPSEFRDFFAHCTSLGFEDRPDYRYLKRIFKDLFERSGYEDDGVYDWDIAKKQNDIALGRTPEEGEAAGGVTVSEAAKATAAMAAGPSVSSRTPCSSNCVFVFCFIASVFSIVSYYCYCFFSLFVLVTGRSCRPTGDRWSCVVCQVEGRWQ